MSNGSYAGPNTYTRCKSHHVWSGQIEHWDLITGTSHVHACIFSGTCSMDIEGSANVLSLL